VRLTPEDFVEEMERRLYEYIDGVLDKSINVGRLERFAVERYIKDLDRTADDIFFDPRGPRRVFKFFALLNHSKGRQARQQFKLSGWQCFIIWNLFGFVSPYEYDEDVPQDERQQDYYVRRFLICYIQIARKNGKSTFAAGIALYLLRYDNEPGAEIYCAATKRDQAKIVSIECCSMALKSTELLKTLTPLKRSGKITYDENDGVLDCLGADSDTLDGLNPHASIIDELHQHKNRGIWDVLLSAYGARDQPMHIAITTAGNEANIETSICYEQRDYSGKLLSGDLVDDSYFAFICELDKRGPDDPESFVDDDWTDPANWRKGNPNLGVSISTAKLKKDFDHMAENTFKRLKLDMWTQQTVRWISMEKWRGCKSDPSILAGKFCYAGLDLASTQDLTALVLVFPPQEGLERWTCRSMFWCPEETVDAMTKSRQFPYRQWVDRGLMIATPGNVCDYDSVEQYINEQASINEIREIGYDPWNATQVVSHLQKDGFQMVEMRQGVGTMHAPSKYLERLVVSSTLDHGDNSILTWCASNVALHTDNNLNIKPDRDKSSGKIDGIVSLIMGIGRANAGGHVTTASIYEGRTLFTP
jgi:phage terminase large subunit-like protein